MNVLVNASRSIEIAVDNKTHIHHSWEFFFFFTRKAKREIWERVGEKKKERKVEEEKEEKKEAQALYSFQKIGWPKDRAF